MFDVIDFDLFTDAVQDHFSVLTPNYVRDICKELHPELAETFSALYETRYVLVHQETGLPVNVNAVLNDYEGADNLLKILGSDKHDIGYLLLNR